MKTKTAFVIGSGPSLNDIDITKLKDYDTICFNRSYIAYEEWGFDPTYYLAIDSNDIRAMYKDIYSLIENSNIQKFFLTSCRDNDKHPSSEHYQDGDHRTEFFTDLKENKKVYLFNEQCVYNIPGANIDEDTQTIHMQMLPNAGFMGIVMLKILGYKEIAFVGCDARYKDDSKSNKYISKIGREYISSKDYDINHFSHKYFGNNMRFGAPNEKEIIKIWKNGAQLINEYIPDLKVYSCTKDSNHNDDFKYIEFEEFLKGKR
jgi:hypothetical protein